MPVTVCWAAKGGSGTTVVTATLALSCSTDSLLVDLDGELPAVLGTERPTGQGVADWLCSDAPVGALDDLAVALDRTHAADPARHASGRPRRACAGPSSSTGSPGERPCSSMPAPGRRHRCSSTDQVRSLLVTRACYLSLTRAVGARRAPRWRRARRRAVAHPAPVRRRAGGRRPGGGARQPRPVDPASCRRRAAASARAPAARPRAARCGMSVAPLDEHLVDELCRAAVAERGDPDVVVRAHLRRVAPLAGSAGRRAPRARRRRPARRAGRARPAARRPHGRRGARERPWRRLGRARRPHEPRRPPRHRPSSPSSPSASWPRSDGGSTAPTRSSTPASPTARGSAR